MEFKSVEEIKKHFDLNTDDPSEIKRELRAIIKTIHPDKNGGTFRTKADEKYFFEIQNAVDFLDNSSIALVTRQELTALTQVFKDLMPITQQKSVDSALALDNKIESSIKYFRHKHLFPKISTTAISLVITALWLFPKSVSEHPILKNYIVAGDPVFNIIWFIAILTCALTWAILKAMELKDKKIKKSLSLDTNLNKIFNRFIDYNSYKGIKDGFFYFNKDELIEFIMDYDLHFDKLNYRGRVKSSNLKVNDFINIFPNISGIDLELAQSVSDVIIEKGLKKKVFERVDSLSLTDTYRIQKVENK